MGLRARRLIVVAVGAASAGCAALLGYGDPVELADRDGAAIDASDVTDGPAPDTSPPRDAGGDADANVAFCDSLSPKPTFCASFDKTSYLGEWASSFTENTTMTRDTTAFESAPASLRVAYAPTKDASVEGTAAIDFDAFKAKPFKARLAFGMRVEAAAPQTAFAVVANLSVLASGGPTFALQVLCRPLGDGASVACGVTELQPLVNGSAMDHGPTQNVTVGEWARIEVEIVAAAVDGGTTGNRVKLVVDGKQGYDGPLALAIGAGTPGLALGLLTVEQPLTTAWALRYDNVTFDIQ